MRKNSHGHGNGAVADVKTTVSLRFHPKSDVNRQIAAKTGGEAGDPLRFTRRDRPKRGPNAPERGGCLAGTATRLSDGNVESKLRRAAEGFPDVPPKASRAPLADMTAQPSIEMAVRLCLGADPAELSGRSVSVVFCRPSEFVDCAGLKIRYTLSWQIAGEGVVRRPGQGLPRGSRMSREPRLLSRPPSPVIRPTPSGAGDGAGASQEGNLPPRNQPPTPPACDRG